MLRVASVPGRNFRWLVGAALRSSYQLSKFNLGSDRFIMVALLIMLSGLAGPKEELSLVCNSL